MGKIKRLSLSVMALAIAATAIAAPSAQARTVKKQDKATHFVAPREDRAYRAGPANAYGAMPGAPGISSPSYSGYGYGYGDNSHSYTN
jgi:hypothetical protein